MNATPELVALLQLERERRIHEDHLVRVATCARACCSPSLVDRLAHALLGTPANC